MDQIDYQSIIDAQTWGFIRATDAAYPPDAVSLSIADQRAIYDRMCRAFHRGYPAGVTAQDMAIAGVPCRVFEGAAPSVIYLHGGGFVVGGLQSHDDICAEICGRTGLRVVCVDYRLSPENPHPAALDDCLAVVRDQSRLGPLVLAGDSAGGNLASALSHALRGSGVGILGQVLIYPGLGGDINKGSYLIHANAPMLTRDDVLFYKDIRHPGIGAPQGDPTVTPLQDRDFSRLPPTLAIAAECDPLADDAFDYVARLTAAGVPARASLAPGLPHGYLRARATVDRAAQSFTEIVQTLSAMAEGRFEGQS
jgi:acetyl esterase